MLTEGGVLIRLAEDNRLGGSHIGTPCISFSWARDPQVRSLEYIFGLPHQSEKGHKMADDGNKLAEFSVQLALALHWARAWLSIENPFTS